MYSSFLLAQRFHCIGMI